MSYWSLRRAAERAAAGHELARSQDDTLPATSPRSRVHDWTPVDRHPATVTAPVPARTLRQRAAELEKAAAELQKAFWTVPNPDPADVDPTFPSGVRVRARSTW